MERHHVPRRVCGAPPTLRPGDLVASSGIVGLLIVFLIVVAVLGVIALGAFLGLGELIRRADVDDQKNSDEEG